MFSNVEVVLALLGSMGAGGVFMFVLMMLEDIMRSQFPKG
jgi:hypothetical protein